MSTTTPRDQAPSLAGSAAFCNTLENPSLPALVRKVPLPG